MYNLMIERTEERIPIVVENQGQKLFGMLHLPKHEVGEQVPAVLFCHGLAGQKTGKHRVYVDLASKLATQGIATLRFDYRGCGDSEGNFYESTPSGHYSDALVFLDYLKQHPNIDTERLGVFGRSFGGTVAVKTAAECTTIRSVALWCPMFSGEQWQDQWQLVQTNSVDEKLRKEMMQVGGQQGSYHFFDELFSLNVSDDLEKLSHLPLLHIHGEVDKRVDIQHARDYESFRGNSLAESKFVKLPNTDHDFSHFDERYQAIDETFQWFTNTL
jgi:uncharacterized protein